jgi:hypothetical protein
MNLLFPHSKRFLYISIRLRWRHKRPRPLYLPGLLHSNAVHAYQTKGYDTTASKELSNPSITQLLRVISSAPSYRSLCEKASFSVLTTALGVYWSYSPFLELLANQYYRLGYFIHYSRSLLTILVWKSTNFPTQSPHNLDLVPRSLVSQQKGKLYFQTYKSTRLQQIGLTHAEITVQGNSLTSLYKQCVRTTRGSYYQLPY